MNSTHEASKEQSYKVRVYAGPSEVKALAEVLWITRNSGGDHVGPVTVEGTEHVHLTILGEDFEDAVSQARREIETKIGRQTATWFYRNVSRLPGFIKATYPAPYTAEIWNENEWTRAAREVLSRRGVDLSVASELASVFANVADGLERG